MAFLGCFFISLPAWATLQDEIQVYDDSINKSGQWGLELHLNATPSGPRINNYEPGDAENVHGYRATPEISYGLTDTLEGGLYLPVDNAVGYGTQFAGPRVRLKWIPKQAPQGGDFYGLNVEVSDIKPQYENAQNEVELRPILGYRTPEWLFVVNPVLDYQLRTGYRQNGPDFAPSFKVGRTVMEGLAAGFEYYSELGQIFNQSLPYQQQDNVLFAVIDVNMAPWVFNFGVGRGLTSYADGWTVKAIFEIPIE